MIKDPLRYYIAEGFVSLGYCKVDQSGQYSNATLLFHMNIPDDAHKPVVSQMPGNVNVCLTWRIDGTDYTYCMERATVLKYGTEYHSTEEMKTIGNQWQVDTQKFKALFREIIEPELKIEQEQMGNDGPNLPSIT